MNHKIKNNLQQTIENMYNSVFLELTQTDDINLQSTIETLTSYVSNEEETASILHLCAEDYVRALMLENPAICQNDFETGMQIIMDDKIQQGKDMKKDAVLTLTFEKNKKVFSTIQIKKLVSLADIAYLLISTLNFGEVYDPIMIINGDVYSIDELKDQHLFDFELSEGSQFHVLFIDEESDIKYTFSASIDKEFESDNENIPFQCIKHGVGGPWLTKQEKAEYAKEVYEEDYLYSLFLYHKMLYERPDLYDELDDDLSNLYELADQMFEEDMTSQEEIPQILN